MLKLFVGRRLVWEGISIEGEELRRSPLTLRRIFSLDELPPFITGFNVIKDQDVS